MTPFWFGVAQYVMHTLDLFFCSGYFALSSNLQFL
uniref:Uncharacterized protein n=1 Tax=Arundo donax TaxID=35708 RepID=A0A0A8XUU6_ARUDO